MFLTHVVILFYLNKTLNFYFILKTVIPLTVMVKEMVKVNGYGKHYVRGLTCT